MPTMTDTTQQEVIRNPLEALAQAHEIEAFSLLVEVIRDKDMKIEHRIKAAQDVMDRARGKAKTVEKRDPNGKKQLKAISMSMDKLLQIAQGAIKRTAQADAIDAEFTRVGKKRPVNQFVVTSESVSALPALPAPAGYGRVVPGTKPASQAELDDLLS